MCLVFVGMLAQCKQKHKNSKQIVTIYFNGDYNPNTYYKKNN